MNGTKTVVLKSGCGTLRSVSLSTVRKTGDGKPTHGKSRCGQSSSFLPHFQQLPDLGLPRFQLGNVVLIDSARYC